MRLFSVAVISFFLLTAHSVRSQDKAKPANPQRETASQPSQAPPPSTTVEVNVGYPREAEDRQPTKQDAKKETAPMSRFEWLITIITAIYSAFSVFTFFMIKRQARAAEGELAAQSPWIMVNIEHTPGMHGRFLGTSRQGNEPETRHTDFIFRFDCINHGRTPALITEKRANLIIVPKDGLTKNPDLRATRAFDDRVEPLAANQESLRKKDEHFSVEGYQGLDEWVVLYVVVKYRYVFGRYRQTTS